MRALAVFVLLVGCAAPGPAAPAREVSCKGSPEACTRWPRECTVSRQYPCETCQFAEPACAPRSEEDLARFDRESAVCREKHGGTLDQSGLCQCQGGPCVAEDEWCADLGGSWQPAEGKGTATTVKGLPATYDFSACVW